MANGPGNAEDDSGSDAASERSRQRKDDREASIEDALADAREHLGEQRYPASSEELAAAYADGPIDLPNETESLASAFDRMDDQFRNAEDAHRALLSEFEGGAFRNLRPDAASGGATWSEERIDDDRPPAGEDAEGGPERARQRASQAQASDAEATDSGTDDDA